MGCPLGCWTMSRNYLLSKQAAESIPRFEEGWTHPVAGLLHLLASLLSECRQVLENMHNIQH